MAAGFLANLVSGGAGELIGKIGETVDRFVTTKEEKLQLKLELEKLLQQRDTQLEETLRQELGAKERILVAELQQGDNYTKRARPTVVYFGLALIGVNYCLAPLLVSFAGLTLPKLDLPPEFWLAWAGIVSTWTVGRSMEKRGAGGTIVSAITGTPTRSRLTE